MIVSHVITITALHLAIRFESNHARLVCFMPAVVEVEFSAQTYTATEAAGDVEICVTLTGEFETVVQVVFITTNSSATINLLNPARPDLDYQSRSVTLTFDEGSPRALCDRVQLEADNILENEESFLVNIVSNEAAVRVLMGSAEVTIIDSNSESFFSA